MDLFTHLMVGYLFSSWTGGSFYNTYVIFGCTLAILPDIDIFFFPLWKRYPILAHHGITHTLIFAFAASTCLFGINAAVTGFTDIRLLALMYFTSLTHLLLDFITSWGVPLLYPASKKFFRLNIDRAVNTYLILFFFIGVGILWLGRKDTFSQMNIWAASYIIGAAYVIYFSSRACIKAFFMVSKRYRGFSALPTTSPFRWGLAKRTEDDDEIIVTVRDRKSEASYVIPKARVDKIASEGDIVAYTFWHPKVQWYMEDFSFPYYRVRGSGDAVEVTWHAAEMPEMFGINVKVEKGNLEVKSWFAPRKAKRVR